ncbi:MAG: RDD family protein [Ilumatobacteraceae bacterium]
MSNTPPPPPAPPPAPPPPPPPPAPPPPMNEVGAGNGPGGRTLPEQWKRIVARLLDGIILGLINLVVVGVVVSGDTGGFDGVGSDLSAGKVFLIGLISLAIGFVWDPVVTKAKGGTPMKLVFKMHVVRADTGDPVEWSHAIIRWGVLAIWGIIPVLTILVPLVMVVVSLVFIFTKPLRQAVWDQVAKTVVVDVS